MHRNLVKALLDEHKAHCNIMLDYVLEAEHVPFTQNGHYYESCKQGWLTKYRAVRSGKVGEEELDPQVKRHRVAAPGFECTCFRFISHTAVDVRLVTFGVGGTASTFLNTNSASKGGPATSNLFSFTGLGNRHAPEKSPSPIPSASSMFGLPPSTPLTSGNGPFASRPIQFPTATTEPKPAPSQQAFTVAQDSDSETNRATERMNSNSPDKQTVQEAIALLVKAGLPVASLDPMDLLGKLIPPDEYETELGVMAEVRGYFQVAYKVSLPCSQMQLGSEMFMCVAHDR